jgi:hypothetical protein
VPPSPGETFAFLTGLRLEVRGDRQALQHFRAEYAAARSDPGVDSDLVVTFGSTASRSPRFEGAYRSLRWRVALDSIGDGTLEATIDLRGAPRSFGLSLLQGYVVEPLLGLLAPATRHVLLPAAAIASQGGALLLVGRSRSGKSTLVSRCAASGVGVLSDDHVLVSADGCRAFPRRLRLYPDIAETAPAASAALPARTRKLLRALGVLRTATGGRLSPPVRVPVTTLGAVVREPLPLTRVVVLERREVPRLSAEGLSLDELVAAAADAVQAQRSALERVDHTWWHEHLDRVLAAEESLLHETFARAATRERLVVPTRLPAAQSIAAIAAALDLGA